jgi:hypothetical protein
MMCVEYFCHIPQSATFIKQVYFPTFIFTLSLPLITKSTNGRLIFPLIPDLWDTLCIYKTVVGLLFVYLFVFRVESVRFPWYLGCRWLSLQSPDNTWENWAFGGMRTDKGNKRIRKKPDPVSLCPPQIPHELTWDCILVAAVWSRWLTA